ncbi:hypothetical protein PTKIN_Ptkin03bG0102100 [Pterospermum kingtungense]
MHPYMHLTKASSEEPDAVNIGLQLVKIALLDDAEAGFKRNFAALPLSLAIFLNLLASGSKGHVLDKFLSSLGSNSLDELYKKSSSLLSVANNEDSSNNNEGPLVLMNNGVWVDQRFSVKPSFQDVVNRGVYKAESNNNGGPLVLMNNGVWVDQRFSVKPSFQDVVNRVYKAEVRYLDFRNKADEVNSWVKEKTEGLIKNILSKSFRTNDIFVIPINALYFKGVWERPFNADLTQAGQFYPLNGEGLQVPFMCEYFKQHLYTSFDQFQLLKLPYRFRGDRRRFSMYIFLPTARDGLNKLIDEFDSKPEFLNQKFELYSHHVDNLKIPKFKFSCRFSIPVNEEGTEAAAITSFGLCGCSMEREPPLNFIADHPFMFMVREDASNVPFFVGAVLNPL